MTLQLERLRESLEYNPETGNFTWKKKHPGVKTGSVAGCKLKSGAIQIMLDNKKYLAHKLAFFYVTGMWPEEVDHINGDPSYNAWSNLRVCSHSQNLLNRKVDKRSSTGKKNVTVDPRTGKFRVVLTVDGKRKWIGSYDSLEMAELVAIEARIKYHQEYARHE